MLRLVHSCLFFAALCGPAVAQDTSATDPLRQPQPSAFFSLNDLGGSFDFDEADWRVAVAGAGVRIFWKIDRDIAMVQRVMEVAASAEGDPPFAVFYAVNLRIDQADTFDQLLDSLVGENVTGDFAGAEFVMKEPLCRLLRLPEPAQGGVREYYVASIDRSEERRACYSQAIAYVLANRQDFQPPPLDRVVVDSAAVMVQAIMPPVAVKEDAFIQPDIWQTERRAAVREGGNVFAPGEMIMLHAILENVGRDMVGTPVASYEIKLDIEIRDGEGTVLADQKDAMRFTGTAIHSVPIRPDYFETGVVAGFPISQPGAYEILYRLTDMNRPAASAVVEIVKQVTIR